MKEFQRLIEIADQLLSPEGCPWDREQTYFTLQPYLLEETHELIEAIDLQSPTKISEELGDVLYALIFISKIGEKEQTFTLSQAIQEVSNKLIRRHPHVFGDKKFSTTEELEKNWEEVKKQEGKKNPLEGIPPSLPSLARAQKVIQKIKKTPLIKEKISDDEIGYRLWELVKEANEKGIDAESALRRTCQAYEEKYRR